MPITTLPTPPARTQAAAVFASNADAFLGALPTFATEANALATLANDNALSATNSAASAAAAAAANGAVTWTNITYSVNNIRVSPVDYQLYRRIVAGTTATDPSADPVNWSPMIRVTQAKIVMGAATLINLATGAGFFTKTIAANTTFTISGQVPAGTGMSFILDLTGAGSYTITWFANLKWTGGGAPTLSTGSGRDVLGFMTHDGGATWTGMILAKGAA